MSAPIPITLKLYASLAAYLPDGHQRNEAHVHVLDGTTVEQLLDAHKMPREACHLVLVNGVYQSPKARTGLCLKTDDAVAVWPPVAGG
ncbi:MAG: MoaD/ThiS family protein [Hyphomicrobiaceae bacterium]|nr:MoaD/ThiS family protein [Hyphomicrobiaceae bacterium]